MAIPALWCVEMLDRGIDPALRTSSSTASWMAMSRSSSPMSSDPIIPHMEGLIAYSEGGVTGEFGGPTTVLVATGWGAGSSFQSDARRETRL